MGLQTIRISSHSRLFFPELRLFAGDVQRQNAFRTATLGLQNTWRSFVFLLLVCGLGGCLIGIVKRDMTSGVFCLILVVLILLTGEYGRSIVWRREIRQSLREQLRLLGIPVCEKCGYDLRGTIEPARCPECGTPFVPPKLPAGTPADAPDEQRGEWVGPPE